MSEPHLILHKVRGEPAFDIAIQVDVPDRPPIWIIPTSGHAAFPVDVWPLSGLLGGVDSMLATDLTGVRDHYIIETIIERRATPPRTPPTKPPFSKGPPAMIVQPPSCLLAGPSGSGKTSAIPTQLLCGLEVFVIMTEPDGTASLLDAAERLKAPIDRLHWTYCPPSSAGWSSLADMIDKISRFDQKLLADQRDMGKADFRPAAMRFLDALRNFTCERTGKSYGDFTTWDDTRSLNIDSLTGWSAIGFGATVGYKPTANPGEWGIAQNFIYNMLMKINTDRRCFFNMTAHVEREMDEVSGVKRVMVSTIGAKLAPKVPTFFSEVIKCAREVDANGNAAFSWSTLDSQMDLKNRALPIRAKMPADFEPVIAAYRRRKELAGAPSSPAPESAPPAKIATMQTIVPPMSRPAT